MELIGCNILNNNPSQFAATISNPVSIRSKGRKLRNERIKAFNDNKYKKLKATQVSHSEASSIYRDELLDIINIHMSCHCGVYSQTGHNSRICNLDNTTQDSYNDNENNDLSLSNLNFEDL
ncbi:7940_t:CDS:1, partial [Racocetra fulgida]